MSRHLSTVVLSALLVATVVGGALYTPGVLFGTSKAAPAPPTSPTAELTYTKVLKGSMPEYEKIIVRPDGTGSYDGRRLSDPSNPRSFKLSASTAQRVFDLTARLSDFSRCGLESGKHVANLGLKTFIYQDGGQTNRCQFNYSTNRTAGELTDLLESIGTVERHIVALDYAMKYDHLGLPRELTLIQIDLDNKALVDPQMMTGTLQKITHNPEFLHLAQVRAEDILNQIQRNN